MEIKIDNLENDQVKELVSQHFREMRKNTPINNCHVLTIDELRSDNITFWSVWIKNDLAGCGALKELNPFHGEIKSMRTHNSHLRKGVAQKLLRHIIDEARERGYERLSLETSSSSSFLPAHALYKKSGFIQCEPFEGYKENSNSIFMTLLLKVQ